MACACGRAARGRRRTARCCRDARGRSAGVYFLGASRSEEIAEAEQARLMEDIERKRAEADAEAQRMKLEVARRGALKRRPKHDASKRSSMRPRRPPRTRRRN